MEDEYAGMNIYEDEHLDFEADDPYEDQEAYLPSTTQNAQGDQQQDPGEMERDEGPEAPSTGAAEQQDLIADLQAQLRESQATADRLRSAFKEVATTCGYSSSSSRDVDITGVIERVQLLRNNEKSLQSEVKQLRQKEAALHIQLADKSFENTELRRELNSAWQASDPSIIQLKQLLLDPAINREFQRLKNELEETQKELKHVQQELQAVNFTQESKMGRALMAKCKSLQEENEEMGRELAEGKMHQLDAQLTIAREYADELKKNYAELSDHCQTLDEEAEHMQQQLFALRNQVHVLEVQAKQQAYDRRQDDMLPPPFMRKPMGRGGGMKRPFPDNREGPMRPMMPGKQRRK